MKKDVLLRRGGWLERRLDEMIFFALAAMLSGGRVFGALAPFALGMVAAAGGGRLGFAALCGAAGGSMLFLAFPYALRQSSIALLLFTANNAFRGMAFTKKKWFLPASTAFFYAAVEGVYLLQNALTAPGQSVFGLVLAVFSALCCRAAQEETDPERRQNAASVVGIGILMALSSVQTAEGISPGRAAAMLFVMLVAFDRPAAPALSFALAAGLAMDLVAGEGNFLYAGIYSIAALAMGFEQRERRPIATVFFCVTLLGLTLPLERGTSLVLLYEGSAAALVFLLLPRRFFRGKRIAAREEKDTSAGAAAAEKLSDAAVAFFELYDSILRAPQTAEENPAAIFDRAAERVCRNCSLCSLCWEKEYNKTYTALNDATAALLERGEGRGEDFAGYFSNRCIRFPSFLAAVNMETHNYLLRCDYRSRLETTRRRAAAQYSQVSQVFSAAAQSVAARETFAVRLLSYRVGVALRPRDGESVSGDTMSWFETAEGELCLILSDGMGSGEAARRESALAVRLLERFLRAGIDAPPALKTLNTAMTLRGESAQSFTTLDLLLLSLASGEAQVYKYGAAPSYIKRGGRVRRITSAALPVGLSAEGEPPERTTLHLEEDSFFLMISDGVADALDDEWLQDFLAGWQGTDPQALAAAVAAEGRIRRGTADDALVLALYLENDGEGRIREV